MSASRSSLRDAILNIEHIAAYMTDEVGNITLWNINAAGLLGYSESKAIRCLLHRSYLSS